MTDTGTALRISGNRFQRPRRTDYGAFTCSVAFNISQLMYLVNWIYELHYLVLTKLT